MRKQCMLVGFCCKLTLHYINTASEIEKFTMKKRNIVKDSGYSNLIDSHGAFHWVLAVYRNSHPHL